MTRSPLATEIRPTFQQSDRTVPGPDMIVLHHGATVSADLIVSMATTGSRQVSSHLVIKDGRIVSLVEEQKRAWSLASAYWDSRALTAECANSEAGGYWPLSAATHESIARVVADWCRRYSIPCDRNHVIGHREVYIRYGASYATACPGGMDLEWIVKRARQILGAGGSIVPLPVTPTATWGGIPIVDIQTALVNAGFGIEIDGIYGPATRAAVTTYQQRHSLTADGDVGPLTWAILQEEDMTPEQSKKLDAIYDALFKDGKDQKDWSLSHKIDHADRMVSQPVVMSPNGSEKWTIAHALDWLMRQVNTILKRLDEK